MPKNLTQGEKLVEADVILAEKTQQVETEIQKTGASTQFFEWVLKKAEKLSEFWREFQK